MATRRPMASGRESVQPGTVRSRTRGRRPPSPLISVVIPTRNEAGNIQELVTRIERSTAGISAEIIFVDDSTDETPAIIQDVSGRSRVSVSLIHRPPERRGNGLGGAVVEGAHVARGHWVCVMDADLQHPPEFIPKLLGCGRDDGADVVVASRYAASGDAAGLGSMRLAVSKLSALAGRLFFPGRVRGVSDSLSGFFLVRREAIDWDVLRPRGFKVLFEILVRFPDLNITETPFRFQARHSGESKASLREGLRYVALLFDLRFGEHLQRLTRFAAVGASGLVVNQALLAALTDVGGFYYLLSAVLATQGSTLWNFALTEGWVFRERVEGGSRLLRMGQFLLMNNGALLVRGPFLVILTSGLGIHYLISNLITLLTLGLTRYLLSDGWIWAESLYKPAQKWFNYNVHGIAQVASEVRLPELEFFYTPELAERPDVTVRVGRPRSTMLGMWEGSSADCGHLRYQESLGQLGFWVEIARGKPMDVVSSPLLKHSPHVLYTNVVEPILRWTLVQKGYALVHCACVAGNGKAVLVTARTDTGKTTTILRLLDREPFSFLSDDMVIVQQDGGVFCYPKPLTISRHTLGAVNGASLSRWERLALQIQSRLHSKSGRQTALTLARLPLPMASVNTIAQMVVPPPKYSIERLIPEVQVDRKAKIGHLVVIEVGPDAQVSLDSALARETLLNNCEDAYGFPPYATLEPFLSVWNGQDLKAAEREIIGEGLRHCGATLIRSQTRDWWQALPRILNGSSTTDHKRTARATAVGDTPDPDSLKHLSPVPEASGNTGQSISSSRPPNHG